MSGWTKSWKKGVLQWDWRALAKQQEKSELKLQKTTWLLHDRTVAIIALQMNYKWLQNPPYFMKGLTNTKLMLVFVNEKNSTYKALGGQKPRSRATNITVIKREKWICVIKVTEETVNLLAKLAAAASTLFCQ